MAKKDSKEKNPFYTLLIWAGVAFAVTATAYGVMTVSYLRASEEITEATDPAENYHPLFHFLDENGFDLMLAELGVLGVLTFAAIAYDQVHESNPAEEATGKAIAEMLEGAAKSAREQDEMQTTEVADAQRDDEDETQSL